MPVKYADIELPWSKGDLNRAGHRLRDWAADESVPAEALHLLIGYRALWQTPKAPVLTGVVMGLRQMAKRSSATSGFEVSQRLKRVDRIIGKLRRFPKMNLARMGDIGGARIVVQSLRDLEEMRGRIERAWGAAIVDTNDYVESPKTSGYRALHLILKRRGLLVEVQVRTRLQHRWAMLVEDAELRTGTITKDGRGEEQTVARFARLGEFLAYLDAGTAVPKELAEQLGVELLSTTSRRSR